MSILTDGRVDESVETVILCGGRGTRLGSMTDLQPKPLVHVGGRPILWHIMDHYARYGFKRFVLCLGYKGEMIKDYFLNYHAHNNDFTVHLGGAAPRVVPQLRDVVDWEVTCADTGLTAMTGARYINGGFFVFDRRIFDYLSDDDGLILESALERLAADDQLRVFRHHGFWQCMDTPHDRDVLEHLLRATSAPVESKTGTASTGETGCR
jgi:glucose-1-phosphate cytidylyltransferase